MSLVKTYKKVHNYNTRCVCVTRDNKYVVSGADDKTVRITRLDNGEFVRVIYGHEKSLEYVYVTLDNKYVVSASFLQFQINYLDNGELLRRINFYALRMLPTSLCITPDNKYLMFGMYDGDIRITRFLNGELVRVIKGHTANVTGLSVTSDNKYVVSISDDKTVRITSLDTGELVRELKGINFKSSSFFTPSICTTSDNKYVALLLEDNTIQIMQLDTGELVRTIAAWKDNYANQLFCFTPDNKYIVSCSFDTVQLTCLNNGKLLKKFKLGIISSSINISPDGNHVVVGGWFGSIAVVVISKYFARRQWAQVLLWKKDFKIFHQYPGLMRYIGNRLLSFC